MEWIIFEDSPLAEYFEGEGEGENEPVAIPWKRDSDKEKEEASDEEPAVSYAPKGPPKIKLPRSLQIKVPPARSMISSLKNICKEMLNSNLNPADSAQFLERYRYTIVASQLLSDHANVQGYNPRLSLQAAAAAPRKEDEVRELPNWTLSGAIYTLVVTVFGPIMVGWARSWRAANHSVVPFFLYFSAFAMAYCLMIYHYVYHIRREVIHEVTSFTNNAQALDTATAAAVSLIQEVELVSRGYRISNPLPPVSRLEDQGQSKRCKKLRHALREYIESLLSPYSSAYLYAKRQAVESDLERYFDIYEISRTDVEEIENFAKGGFEECEDPQSLRSLKVSIQRLHAVRKLFLCCLLAIRSDGRRSYRQRWNKVKDMLGTLSTLSAAAAKSLDTILLEEERYTCSEPKTPAPSSPGYDTMKSQIRKFASLSQGTRELQARMFILKEDSNKALESPADLTKISGKLLEQYDAFGMDLKNLLREWENGRRAIVSNIDKHERRVSLTPMSPLSRPESPSSFGGKTLVGGGPDEALKILNGEVPAPMDATSSDEELFEAIALPRPKSTMTREERIQKMREERVRRSIQREKADAGKSMVKELESVIRLRPRSVKPGRITSL